MITYISNSLEDTNAFAKVLSKKIKKGDTILFFADMGAGKTTLTKSLLKELGVQSNVTSPTFTIVNEYVAGNTKINHFDFYRIEDESEAEEIGLREMIEDKNSVNIIEWPQNISSILPRNYIKITIKKGEGNKREFLVEGLND